MILFGTALLIYVLLTGDLFVGSGFGIMWFVAAIFDTLIAIFYFGVKYNWGYKDDRPR